MTTQHNFRQMMRDLNMNTRQIDPTHSNEFSLGGRDINEHLVNKIVAARYAEELSTITKPLNLLIERSAWNVMLEELGHTEHYKVFQVSSSSGIVVYAGDGVDKSYFSFSLGQNNVSVMSIGSRNHIDMFEKLLTDRFEVSTSNLEWIYGLDGESITVAVRGDRNPTEEMYSFLGDESLASYYDRFMAATPSILLLIGKPGTGKTSFIRGLLQHCKIDGIVTYDPEVLKKDYVFANFVEGNSSVFIIEDADTLLRARTDGNNMMHKFLNVGDGLVTTQGKKMIFSTNLPSVNDVDPALLRPGRCYDVLNFDTLNKEQTARLCAKFGLSVPNNGKDDHTLAEVFNLQEVHGKVTTTNSKFGFM